MSALSNLSLEEKKQVEKDRKKAINEALKKEKELVQQGKGTRDWTLEQQQDILNGNRPRDENGVAYEGHHMKSVSEFPEHAGNPSNIQWLSYDEHINGAHQGNTHNPTNGYYNPNTKEMQSHEGMSPIAPEPIKLKNPIVKEMAQEGILSKAIENVIIKGVTK
jgi:hypothetical protein